VSAVLPLKDSSRELIIEVSRALQPYFPDITAKWREKIAQEFQLDGRIVVALEQLQVGAACAFICNKDDFKGLLESLSYHGSRLAKLQVDTRVIARALELYLNVCEPYVGSLFGERRAELIATLETLSSACFVVVSGSYFDAKSEQNAALLSILDAELSAADLLSVFSQVLEITAKLFGATIGVLMLKEPGTNRLQAKAALGFKAEDDFSIEVGQGFSGSIAASGMADIVLDPSHDGRVASPALRQAASTLWGMPLNANGEIIGVLVVGFTKPYEWLPTEREMMRAIADRSALAIDRRRMIEALREREIRIAELSGHLLRVQEDERKRISRELHDETGQALMVIRLYLGMLESTAAGRGSRSQKNKIRETVEVVDRTIEGIRRIIGRLSPLVLKELGLVAAIRKEAKDLAKNTGIRARVMVAEDVNRLDPEVEMVIYRVVQEALHNVAKHSHAKSANIILNYDAERIRLLVEDDGVGFSAKSSNSRGNSFGLAGIKERVHSIGGEVRVVSSKERGTRIEVAVPLREASAPLAKSAEAGAISTRVH
jgi:signal transduction histidine kinase